MTFIETLEKFIDIPDWKSLIDNNFNRKSGIYSYLTYTETTIQLEKTRLILPKKIVFLSGFQRLRRKSSNKTIIEYKGRKVTIDEKVHVIPFGTYERKFKFSGSFSEIINDVIKAHLTITSSFSDKPIDNRNNPLYGIDSTIEYPSYILHLIDRSKVLDTSSIENTKPTDNNEFKVLIKDILSILNINYNIKEVSRSSIFIIFPLPYVRILENRLDTTGDNEKIALSIEFNKDYYNIFKSSKIELQYEISEVNKESIEKSSMRIDFTGKSIYEIGISPNNISKIGLCSFKILVNDIQVNQFNGSYIRGFKINTKIVSK